MHKPTSGHAGADDLNTRFHAAYDTALSDEEGPVLIVLADALVLRHGRRRQAVPLAPAEVHLLKSVAHVPIALYVLLRDGHVPEAELRQMTKRLTALATDLAHRDNADAMRQIAAHCLTFIAEVTSTGHTAGMAAFAAEMAPLLLRCTDEATALQLHALDAEVRRIWAALDPVQRAALHVVVTGDHQARRRSLAMQYFEKLFGEPPGAEERVLYGEGVTDEKEALGLIATKCLNAAIASCFFGDPKRLQRDILGDSATAQLRHLDCDLPLG